MTTKIKAAIIGSGNIGTDLMMKMLKYPKNMELVVVVGIDPLSEGLALAREHGLATTHDGIEGLRSLPFYPEIGIVFDATSAYAHKVHDAALRADGKLVVDLTPAAIGPFIIPPVNMDEHLTSTNVNMVTCGGQATIPMVAAVAQVATVNYAEIVASVSSRSAGPGTRANIDEFTRTTARAIEKVGGAVRGKAIIILNPAEPPMIMRDTVYTLSEGGDEATIRASIEAMISKVQAYVPGYRLKQAVQFERFGDNNPLLIPGQGAFTGIKTTIFLEVEGAGDYLPSYSGNLDIMTAAAKATGELLAERRLRGRLVRGALTERPGDACGERDRMIEAAAHALAVARRLRRPISRLSLMTPDLSEAEAYRIAGLTTARQTAPVVGYKLGYTSEAMRAQMGIAEPNYGFLLDDEQVADGLTFEHFIHPLVEPEFAVRLGANLDGSDIDEKMAWQAVSAVMPALEIVDSRYHDYDFRAVDNIADNSSAARFVLGPAIARDDTPELSNAGVRLFRDGVELAVGSGSDVMGGPAIALAWLANRLGGIGGGLKAGQIVLTGGITRAHPARAGDAFSAVFEGLGTVAATF